MSNFRIRIPMINGHDTVEFFPDELPVDYNDVIDVLRSELAPFKVWRSCANEYHKQGFQQEFDAILSEIVIALENPSVDIIYRERDDYAEGITEVFVALAARALLDLFNMKHSATTFNVDQNADYAKKVVDYLKNADEKLRLNEYTWLIKGFYEIVQGDFRRAEDHFRSVHDRASKGQNAGKKKYLFGSLLGLGVVHYSRQQFQFALDHFAKALMCNPDCGANVRLSIACCCFKLEQYERAVMAADKAFSLEPLNANVLTMRALLAQPSLKLKDRSASAINSSQSHSFEYSSLAASVDPCNAVALNLVANYRFLTWKTVVFRAGGAFVLEGGRLAASRHALGELRVGDMVRINGVVDCFVVSIVIGGHGAVPVASGSSEKTVLSSFGNDLMVVFVSALPVQRELLSVGAVQSVQLRALSSVVELANSALACSGLSPVRAESHYIVGKVMHLRGNTEEAFECYRKALKESPELTLAAFGAAQILFSRCEFAAALELFEKVLSKSPEDKDSQAYVILLKALHKSTVAPFEKLREIAPGFRFEIDLWLLQGQLWQQSPSEHATALKCYLQAKDCIEHRSAQVPAVVLSNISVLYHSLGACDKAVEFCKSALATHQRVGAEVTPTGNSIYCNADFENVFYCWSESPVCMLMATEEVGRFGLVSEGGRCSDLTQVVSVGDEVVVEGVKHVVREVSASLVSCYSPVKLSTKIGDTVPLIVKRSLCNFSDHTITYCYNLARVLEDMGSTKSASEIYVELLKNHPSFIECYLRLSLISCGIGKFDDASVWLTRALEVNGEQPDATICLGDLYYRKDLLLDARKCYDKICAANRHDARSMLSLGNYLFSNPLSGGKARTGGDSGSHLKESYKFFFHVLNEDLANIYAANGLGMVCAEKGELEAAREIFSKAREANKKLSGDISTNLAHVYLMQSRLVDAERLYQATLKSLTRNVDAAVDKVAYLQECVSHAQFRHGRHDDSLRSLQRALRLNPSNLKLWFNLGVVCEAGVAALLSKKAQKSTADIAEAAEDISLAVQAFTFITDPTKTSHLTSQGLDRKSAHDRLKSCKEKAKVLVSHMVIAKNDEVRRQEERSRQESEHASRLRVKLEEKERLLQAHESEKREKQLLAVQKEKKLQELRDKWVVSEVSAQSVRTKQQDGAPGGPKRRKKNDRADLEDGGVFEEKDKFDADIDRSTYEGEIDFGSSSEDDVQQTQRRSSSHTQIGIDLFGDDDSDEDLVRPVASEAPEDSTPSRKRLRRTAVADLDSDEENSTHLAD